jgi:ArsR family transcriptional regulator
MGTTKTENFNKVQNRIAELAKAIGHPARIAILEVLIKRNACICNDIVEELPLSQSTISQHLKALKEVGLIQGDIEGTSICYCINEKVWKETQGYLNKLFNAYVPGDSCC